MDTEYLSKWCTILAILLMYYVKYNKSKELTCYALRFLDTSWTDRRPDFRVNMTFSNDGNIKSNTWVEKEVSYPVSKLRVVEKGANARKLRQFNVTARLCEIRAVLNNVPVVNKAFLSATKDSNLTLECPLKTGFYVMDNISIDKGSRVLAFMYRPKVSYLFEGGLYEEVQHKKLRTLTTYRFTAKVVKRPCND